MKKYSFLSLLIFAIYSTSIAQNTATKCGFDDIHQNMMENNEVYRNKTIEFNDFLIENPNFMHGSRGVVYQVPVVVHVMHTGEAEGSGNNISDESIKQAIRELNQMYRKIAGTKGDGNGVDVEIEFALAIQDPQGNCTDGIVRYDMSGDATYVANGVYRNSAGITDDALKAYSVWDQTKYYNIWLVTEIDNNGGGSGTQGYAYFASSHGNSNDGAVILAGKFATSGNTTATHELGHAFNLYHTFEGDNGGASCPSNTDCSTDGDLCCDTPPHIRSSSDCDDTGTNSCTGGSKSAYVYHYMDYSDDDCQNMFSSDQATRMKAALTTTRSSFTTSNALTPTGLATVDFNSTSDGGLCTNSSVTFYDESSCTPNTYLNTAWSGITFSWSVTNGTDTYTSTEQNPTFTITATGTYDVSLSVTNSYGTASTTKQGMIVVAGAPTAACTPTGSTNEGNFWQTLNRVVFNTIDNSTDYYENTAYTDFSCTQSTIVSANTDYVLSVDLNATGGSGNEVYEAFIDYNDDGDFDDVGEQIGSGSVTSGNDGTLTATVTIPASPTLDTPLRMRVIGETNTISSSEKSCSANYFIGDVEDYAVIVSSKNAEVSLAASPSTTITYGTSVTVTATPTNGGAGPTYAWYKNGSLLSGETGATYITTSFVNGDEIYCIMTSNLSGVTNSPATSNTLTMSVTGTPITDFTMDNKVICQSNSVNFTDLSDNSPTSWSWTFSGGTPGTSTSQNPTVSYSTAGTYSVTLTASNGEGTGTTLIKTDSITVVSSPATSGSFSRSFSPAADIGTHRVTLSTIDNSTAWDGAVYNDYACTQATALEANTQYNISVILGPSNDQWLRVYIDYDNDGDMTEAGETIFSPANGQGTQSGTFTTPASPLMDQYLRLRVITDFAGGGTTPGPTESPLAYGEVEDYSIYFPTTVTCTSPTASITTTSPGCVGGTDGTATVSASGGTTPYTYLWSDSQTTATATGLSAGTYNVTVTENESCTTVTSTTITDPAGITISTASTSVTCNGASTGTASATPSGGTTPYTYTWSNSSTATGVTTHSITGLTAGTYTITVSDDNSCASNESITVTEATAITITESITSVTCNGGSDGQISVTPSGGTSPYTYLWSDSSTDNPATGLSAGTVSVTVTDNNSCTSVNSSTVTEPSAITVTLYYSNASCNGASDWQAAALVSGGYSPYSYVWSNAETTVLITGLTTGIYSATVTDNNSCTNSASTTISDAESLGLTLTPSNVLCNGNSTGSITPTVTGGITPYFYSWSNGATTSSVSGLAAGTYTLTLTDLSSCTVSENTTITEPTALTVSLASTSVTCYGQSTGTASASVSGGTTAYSYLWSNSGTSSSINSLAAGTYTLTLTDANSCTDIQSTTVTQQEPLLATASASDLQPGSGYALTFSGSNYITTSGSLSFSTISGSAWIKTSSTGTVTIIGAQEGFDGKMIFYVQSGLLTARIEDNLGNRKIYSSTSSVNDNSWHHVAFTYNSSSDVLKLYIDGVLDTSPSTDEALTYSLSVSNFSIGTFISGTNNFSGSIDEVVLWSKELSATEVRNDMCQKLTISHSSLCDIIGYYRLDESSGSTAKDWVGTNNGTLVNSPTYALSGAPIGDASAYDYNAASSSVNLAHADGDDLNVTISSGTPSGLHVYRVDEQPNTLSGIEGTDNDRYFGVYIIGTGNHDARYNYAGHSYGAASSENDILFFERASNATATWSTTGATPVTTSDYIETSNSGYTYEYILHLDRSVWTGATDTDWNTAGNWSPSAVPGSGAHITIPDVTNQPVMDQDRTVGNLYIESGATLDLNTFTLSIENNLDNSGSIIYGTGGVAFTGSDDQTINGDISFYNVSISNSATGVTIESGVDSIYGTLTFTDGSLTTNDSLIFVSNASGTARIAEIPAGSSITNDIIIQRYLPTSATKGWRFLGSPVGTTAISEWNDDIVTSGFTGSDAPSFSFVSAYTFDETLPTAMTSEGWTSVTSTSQNISSGQGILIWVNYPQGKTIDLKGNPNVGDVNFSISNSLNGDANDGWNLIANPYMSTIDWDDPDWVKTNMDETIYIWDPAGAQFATYNTSSGGVNGGTRYIESSQGFIVVATTGAPTLTAKEGVKVSNTSTFFRSSLDKLTLEVINNSNSKKDETVIIIDDLASFDFNGSHDAKKLKSLSAVVPSLSTVLNDVSYTINRIPGITIEQSIPLLIENATSTNMTINVTEFPEQLDGACYQLYDKHTGSLTDLYQGASYTFAYNDSTTTARFEIRHCCTSLSVNVNAIGIPCNGADQGSVDFNINGGKTPYNYTWENNMLLNTGNQLSINALNEGSYTMDITDGNNCNKTLNVNIIDPNFTYQLEGSKTSNSGNSDGEIIVNIDTPENYTFEWSNGDNTQHITGLPEGTYTVSITNDLGCIKTDTYSIGSCGIILSETIAEPLCGISVGQINVNASNGLNSYSYTWSGNQTTSEISNLAAGIYVVTVTDEEGCQASKTYELTGSEPIYIGLETFDPNCENYNGQIIANASGGNSDYTYNWTDNKGNTYYDHYSLINVSDGIYNLTVTDAQGCTSTISTVLYKPMDFTVSSSIVNASSEFTNDGLIALNVSGGSGIYLFNWSNGAMTSTISNLATGEYSVTVTDQNGCSEIQNFNVSSGTVGIDDIKAVNSFNIYPNPNNGSFTLVLDGEIENALSIEVYDGLGKLIFTDNMINQSMTQIDLSGIESGVYMIAVKTAYAINTKRFIVK